MMMVVVMVMMMARDTMMMVLVLMHKRQLGTGSNRSLLYDWSCGSREREAYCRNSSDNYMPDVHRVLPKSSKGPPPCSARIVVKPMAVPLLLKSNVAYVSRLYCQLRSQQRLLLRVTVHLSGGEPERLKVADGGKANKTGWPGKTASEVFLHAPVAVMLRACGASRAPASAPTSMPSTSRACRAAWVPRSSPPRVA